MEDLFGEIYEKVYGDDVLREAVLKNPDALSGFCNWIPQSIEHPCRPSTTTAHFVFMG